MITTITASGITGTEIDVDAFFAGQDIDREGFERAATGHLAMLALGETDELGFDLVPGDRSSYVKTSEPCIYDDGHEYYAHLGGMLVEVRLDALFATTPVAA